MRPIGFQINRAKALRIIAHNIVSELTLLYFEMDSEGMLTCLEYRQISVNGVLGQIF